MATIVGCSRDEEVTAAVNERLPLVDGFVARSRAVAGGSEPQVRTGEHCSTPYDCPFRTHCDAWQAAIDGPPPEYPVDLLARRNVGRVSALERSRISPRGWVDVRDLPERLLGLTLAHKTSRARSAPARRGSRRG